MLSDAILMNVDLECWDQSTPSNSPKALGKKKKLGERKGPSRGIIQKCAPHERSPCAPKFEDRSHEETLHQERCARKAAWDFRSSRIRTKLCFILLLKHEEAQVFVHDLNQFVTVQLLEETPAVVSPGKLCKDHRYSDEWVSGQEPRLTKNWKSITCKTDIFVPLVVPELSVNSGNSSSCTAPPQESFGLETPLVSGNKGCSKLIFRLSIRAK